MTHMHSLLGIDIGGTSVKIGVIHGGDTRQVLQSTSIPTQSSDPAETFVQRVASAARDLIRQSGQDVAGVGVGCPGLISPTEGMVKFSPNLPNLPKFPLRDRLAQLIGLDVEIQNDANAAVLGEWLFGPNKGLANLILLTLGTGVGGGVVADGRLLLGADNGAAELGHVKVQFDNGAFCACGKRGCIEAYAGAAGITRIAADRLAQGGPTILRKDKLSTRDIAAAADAEDLMAREILRTVGQHLGRGIANFIDIFNPDKVVIGGGASAAMEHLSRGIDPTVAELVSFGPSRDRAMVERLRLSQRRQHHRGGRHFPKRTPIKLAKCKAPVQINRNG